MKKRKVIISLLLFILGTTIRVISFFMFELFPCNKAYVDFFTYASVLAIPVMLFFILRNFNVDSFHQYFITGLFLVVNAFLTIWISAKYDRENLHIYGGYARCAVYTKDVSTRGSYEIQVRPIDNPNSRSRFIVDKIDLKTLQYGDTVIVMTPIKCLADIRMFKLYPTKEQIEIAKKGGYYYRGELEVYDPTKHPELPWGKN